MKTYTELLEEIKILHSKFADSPNYYGMLRRIDKENADLRLRVSELEKKLNGIVFLQQSYKNGLMGS